MANLLDLANFLDDYAKEVEETVISYTAQFALNFYLKVQELSPVDTSQLISNWVITINDKPTELLAPIFPGSHGSTAEESQLAATSKAVGVLKTKKPGDTIYISNLSPQVVYTNYGTSNITPQYFIEESIAHAKATSNMDNVKIKVTR